MVHALREAHRVLRPEGILFDVRPGAAHRRVGIGCGRRFRRLGVMREPLEKDRAANRAVREVIHARLFRRGAGAEFDFDRELDTIDDFRIWLEDFGRDLEPHDWMIRKLERALSNRNERIVVRGPMTMRLLHKMG